MAPTPISAECVDAPPKIGDGPSPDGTYFYTSPKHQFLFRITQILQGGASAMVKAGALELSAFGLGHDELNRVFAWNLATLRRPVIYPTLGYVVGFSRYGALYALGPGIPGLLQRQSHFVRGGESESFVKVAAGVARMERH